MWGLPRPDTRGMIPPRLPTTQARRAWRQDSRAIRHLSVPPFAWLMTARRPRARVRSGGGGLDIADSPNRVTFSTSMAMGGGMHVSGPIWRPGLALFPPLRQFVRTGKGVREGQSPLLGQVGEEKGARDSEGGGGVAMMPPLAIAIQLFSKVCCH